MKWGRQQQQQQQEEQHPSSAFSLSQVFPLSWISKLKQMGAKIRPPKQANPKRRSNTTRPKQKSHKFSISSSNSPAPSRAPQLSPDRRFRVSSASDHLSFSPAILDRLVERIPDLESDGVSRRHSRAGDEDIRLFDDKNKRRGGRIFESARYHTAATEPDFLLSSFRSCGSDLRQFESHQKFTETVSDNRRSRNLDISLGIEGSEDEPGRGRGSDAPQRRIARDRRTGVAAAEDFAPPLKPIQSTTIARDSRCSARTREFHRQFSASESSAEDRRSARKSFSGKMRQRSRVRVYSPRTASKMETSRVRARKEKKRRKGEEEKRKRSLESFAVVKCSFDPQKDFRDSMVEMISENGIGRPEELESLLACYLSLNSEEYHDVIVKVFRQVWFDLNPERFVSESEEGEGECL